MSNVWHLFRGDMRRLFSNAMNIIITVGLVVMPSIFAWYNIIACWNVFDNTGNLTVAVANVDDGYESDLVPLRVNIGEQVVSALRANDEIDWTFTTEEDAVDGARSGRYYAAVVIPHDFSRDMLTFYSDDVQHAKIVYYANEKKSAIAPKITDRGADSVSYQVNEVFAETLSEVALSIAESLSHYADESDAGGRIADLSAHVRSMGDQVDRMASVLTLYSSLAGAAQSLVGESAQLVEAAQHQADGLGSTASQGAASAASPWMRCGRRRMDCPRRSRTAGRASPPCRHPWMCCSMPPPPARRTAWPRCAGRPMPWTGRLWHAGASSRSWRRCATRCPTSTCRRSRASSRA